MPKGSNDMVELKDFVAESLKQLIEGVVIAQKYANETGATVNPKGLFFDGNTKSYMVSIPKSGSLSTNPPVPQIIEFDIAVTASEGSEAKAGIGVFSGVIGLGTQAKMEGSNATLSRIKFSIPVLYPEQVIR